jgi:hypothetical protein
MRSPRGRVWTAPLGNAFDASDAQGEAGQIAQESRTYRFGLWILKHRSEARQL